MEGKSTNWYPLKVSGNWTLVDEKTFFEIKKIEKPKNNDELIWRVFLTAYEKYRSKQIEESFKDNKKEVIQIIKTLLQNG